MSCLEPLIQEFQPEKLGLEHDNPSDFVRSQWPLNQKLYVAYRCVVSIGLLIWFVVDILYESDAFYKDKTYIYLIYATNWSFILLVLTSLFQAVCVVVYSLRTSCCLDHQTFERMPLALKMLWTCQNLGYNTALVVTISYWSFVIFLDHSEIFQTDMSRLKHSLNTAYVLVELFISGTPIRILHVFFSVMLGSFYAMFNAVYFLNDGTISEGRHYAYNVLDWRHPPEAIVTSVLCIIQTVLSQVILYEWFRVRAFIFGRIYFSEIQAEVLSPEGSETQSIMTNTPKYLTLQDQTITKMEEGHP